MEEIAFAMVQNCCSFAYLKEATQWVILILTQKRPECRKFQKNCGHFVERSDHQQHL
jgi:hypothetical protein